MGRVSSRLNLCRHLFSSPVHSTYRIKLGSHSCYLYSILRNQVLCLNAREPHPSNAAHSSKQHLDSDADPVIKSSLSLSLGFDRAILGEVSVLVQVQDALALSCVLFDHIVVHFHDLQDSADLEGQTIGLRELLEDWAELRVVVPRHGGEEVMLKLVLHPAEEVLCDEVVATNSTGARKVVRHVTVGGVCSDNFFCLMVAGHNNGCNESTNEN